MKRVISIILMILIMTSYVSASAQSDVKVTLDGNEIFFNKDYFGEDAGEKPIPGPIAGLKAGFNRVKVW